MLVSECNNEKYKIKNNHTCLKLKSNVVNLDKYAIWLRKLETSQVPNSVGPQNIKMAKNPVQTDFVKFHFAPILEGNFIYSPTGNLVPGWNWTQISHFFLVLPIKALKMLLKPLLLSSYIPSQFCSS